jgi:hypothetical protein
MKVAFVTFPHSGHFNPMSALARRLQTRGHEAVLFSLPIAEAGARAAGLPFVPFGQDPALDQALSRAGGRISKSRGLEVLRHTLELMSAMLQAKRRELPGLFKVHGIEAVVVDDCDWHAGTIPLQLGLPFAAVACALVYDFSGRTPPAAYDWPHEATPAARERNRRGAAELSKMVRTGMAEPIAELEAAGLKMDWDDPSSLYANRPWITQCPREFDFEDPHGPAEFCHAGPFHDGGGRPEIAFPWERLTGAPLVYASMGTMLNGDPGVFPDHPRRRRPAARRAVGALRRPRPAPRRPRPVAGQCRRREPGAAASPAREGVADRHPCRAQHRAGIPGPGRAPGGDPGELRPAGGGGPNRPPWHGARWFAGRADHPPGSRRSCARRSTILLTGRTRAKSRTPSGAPTGSRARPNCWKRAWVLNYAYSI